MNWLLTIRRLLGRFWYDVFEDSQFLLGVEHLLTTYSQLVENQYLNWRNGMIAKDLTVEQDGQPFLVYLDTAVTREWKTWEHLWDAGSAVAWVDDIAPESQGWITYSKDSVPVPFYMQDHTIGYTRMLIKGMDYDVYGNKFLFYTDPAALGLPKVKIIDKAGMPHEYYRMFGYARKTVKVCDPVTGFESSWLNDCSDIAWDIHQNGVTFYNMKQLLGTAAGSVICEKAGTVDVLWTEQDYNCLSVDGKVYYSKKLANVTAGSAVNAGDVLFGALKVYTGADNPANTDVPGIRIQTDAGELVAINTYDGTLDPGEDAAEVAGMFVLPLEGPEDRVLKYQAICAANMKNANCPYISVPPVVNPYRFVTQTLRRGRSVTVRLVAAGLEKLAAALNCIRKSCCASGMVNVYVEAEADTDTLNTSVFSADAGMMAVAVVETMTIKGECAEAEVIL